MKVLLLESIPNEKKEFDKEIILWRRKERTRIIITWGIAIGFIILFLLVMISSYQNKKYATYFPLVLQGEYMDYPYPSPAPASVIDPLLYRLEQGQGDEYFVYLPIVIQGETIR